MRTEGGGLVILNKAEGATMGLLLAKQPNILELGWAVGQVGEEEGSCHVACSDEGCNAFQSHSNFMVFNVVGAHGVACAWAGDIGRAAMGKPGADDFQVL